MVASTHPSCESHACVSSPGVRASDLCVLANGLLSCIHNRQGAKSKSCFFFLDVGTCLCIFCGVVSKAHHAPKCEDEIDFFSKSLSNVEMLFVGRGVR